MTISFIHGWIHAWTCSRKQQMHNSWIFTVFSDMANHSFNFFVSLSINDWKEKNSSGVSQFWKKRKQWSTSPTITWSPWRWSFSKHTKWRTRERRRKSIDQNSRLFLFYRAFYLSFRYYELGSTLRTGNNHSCAIVLRLSRA